MKKVLMLSGSPRVHGNSSLLCDEFGRGAKEAGHEVEKILVARKKVAGCLGCGACMPQYAEKPPVAGFLLRNGGTCVQKDDMAEIREKMVAADVIVLASPIYYYTMSAQLKAVLDRCYAFGHTELVGKTFYYLISCAAPEERYTETMVAALRGFVSCAPESREGGMVLALGTNEAGDVRAMETMKQAFEMGKNI